MKKRLLNQQKRYAQNKGQSLSSLVENYLKSVSKEKEAETLSPKVSKLLGVIKLPEGYDYKKELGNILSKKYEK